jgi:hypothetical protein
MSHTLLLLEDEADTEHLPPFFCFSRRDLLDFDDAKKAIKSLQKRRHKEWQAAARISAKIDADMVPQHTPFL